MNHKKELAAALLCMLLIAAFVIGMRAGLHDMQALEAEIEKRNEIIAELEQPKEPEKEPTEIIVTYEYIPMPVDYETVTEIDETDAVILAKTLWGEYRDSANYAQCASVVWCVLNRVDAGYGSIEAVCTGGQFFGYARNNPVDAELYKICVDVLYRWHLEKVGANTDVGRTIPSDFLWFEGNGKVNIYRNAYNGGEHITP